MKTELALLIMTDGNPSMSLHQIAKLRGIDFRTAQNKVYAKTLGIPVWKDGAEWFAHVSDVANWMDSQRVEAHKALGLDATKLLQYASQPA